MIDREVALVDPVALELLVNHAADLFDPDLVDQHLDAGPGAVDPQPGLAVEDPEDGLGDLEEVAVVGLDEVVERRRDACHDRGPAADPDLEAPDPVAYPADEGDVVDARDRPVGVGAGEGRLDLARHQLGRRVAHEVAHVSTDVGGRVEDLVRGDAGPRVAGHVAHGVAAALSRREPARREIADQVAHLPERYVVDLDVLTGRYVTLLQRRVGLDRIGEGVHLFRSDPAVGQLDPDHLNAGLALSVDPLLEAEADELGFRGFTVEELIGLAVEVVEFMLEYRDHVAGDIRVGLRVVQRPEPALALLEFAVFLLDAFVTRFGLWLLRRFGWGRGRLHRCSSCWAVSRKRRNGKSTPLRSRRCYQNYLNLTGFQVLVGGGSGARFEDRCGPARLGDEAVLRFDRPAVGDPGVDPAGQ